MKKREDYPYFTTFASAIHCQIDEEFDKELAIASLNSLRGIIPTEIENNFDLLPIAFNACVANRANQWGDIIGTEDAIILAPNFVHKLVDVEHNRGLVIGHVVNASLSSFEPDINKVSSKIILAADVKDSQKPFNISLAAVIYRVINKDLISELVDSSDPLSPNYMSISASWEVGFKDWVLAVGSRDLADCEIITDPELIQKWTPCLKSKKGNGRLEDGRLVNRLIQGDIAAFGVGLTVNPAADVRGIVTSKKFFNSIKKDNESNASSEEPVLQVDVSSREKEKISQIEKTDVKDNSMSKITVKSIEELNALTEEQFPQVAFASIKDVLNVAILNADKVWKDKLAAEETAKTQLSTRLNEVEQSAQASGQKVTELEAKIKEFNDKEQARASSETLQTRLGGLDGQFELSSEERVVLSKQIAGLNEEAFASWLKDYEVIAAAKKKIVHDPKNDKCACASCAVDKKKKIETAMASAPADVAAEVTKTALAGAAAAPSITVPQTAATDFDINKYRKAFGSEGIKFSMNTRK